MLKEFANYVCNTYLFTTIKSEKDYLGKPEFMNAMKVHGYILVKPHEIRKKYTEFVF